MKIGDYVRDLGVNMRIKLNGPYICKNVRMLTGLNSALQPYIYTLGSRSADTVYIFRNDPTGNCGYTKTFSTKIYIYKKKATPSVICVSLVVVELCPCGLKMS